MIRIFGHYIARNTLIIGALEALIITGSVYIAAVMLADSNPLMLSDRLLGESLALTAILLLMMSLLGVYQQSSGEGPEALLLRLMAAAALGFALASLLARGIAETLSVIGTPGAVGTATAVALIALERVIIFRWPGARALRPQVMILGTGSRAAHVDELLQHQPNTRRMDVVGYLPANEPRNEVSEGRLLNRASGQSLWDVVQEYGITEIVVGVRDRRNGGLPVQELLECRLHGIQVTNLTDFVERETGQIPVESVNTSWFIFTGGFRKDGLRNIIKRLFDILVSGMLLIVALPIMLVAALAIVATMGRPIFYNQQRVGVSGETFTIRKFRSMRNDAEAPGTAQWAQTDDDRITPVGKWIRFLRIDELPQIINVFDGDMSFVGPRPERPEFVHELSETIPFYQARHSIKPGITGWAQVRYAYGASIEDAKQKLQYDLYYVKNHTLFLDLMILLETVQVVLFGKGAR